MPEMISRYNWQWPADLSDLEIEFQAIRYGGNWRPNKRVEWSGGGLFYHYKRAMSLIWPDDDHHRWSDLMIENYLKETITVVQGGKDSSKTHTAAKLGLIDYWTFPDDTLVMISSTTSAGADYRVWGDLKGLVLRARERFDWLPGKALESKHAICTDDLEETDVRDPRKGLVFIPCFGAGGQWLGLSRYAGIKQKRRRLIGDECFPAGTLVESASGYRPIETIKDGDYVQTAIGFRQVEAIMERDAQSLVRITTKGGRHIVCTPQHQFFTQKGWEMACNLNQQHYMLSGYEAFYTIEQNLRTLPADVFNEKERTAFLRSCLRSEMDSPIACSRNETIGIQKRMVENSRSSEVENGEAHADGKSNVESRKSQESSGSESPPWATSNHQRRKWNRTNESGSSSNQDGAAVRMEFSCQDAHESRHGIPNALQTGHCDTSSEVGHRSGWRQPQQSNAQSQRCEEGLVPHGDWVDSVEVLKQDDPEIPCASSSGYRVYNLQVGGHPSYVVNGFLVHNCEFMRSEYVDVLSNLNSGDFKGMFLGNPIGENDPLDRLAEPVGGWGSEGDIKKTATWRNKFGGVTINLYGPDSPNFDHAQVNGQKRYSYLIGQRDIDWIANAYGRDSSKFWMQAMGVRKAGLTAKRVITEAMCIQFNALQPCTWSGAATTLVAGLDAAYGGVGGDRCVLQIVEFGPGMVSQRLNDGMVHLPVNEAIAAKQDLLKCHAPILVPVAISKPGLPEDQIAQFCKAHCESLGIPPANFFFDGRGSLAMSLAKEWSAQVNSVEFGGKATERPVSLDHYIYDQKLKMRRFKRCDEEYSKFVTELWFSVRYAIMSGQMRELPRETMMEGCRREWKPVHGDRHEVETKAEMKERTNQSPDLMDALAIAVEGARRRGFQIAKMSNAVAEAQSRQWLDDLAKKADKLNRKGELNFKA